MLVRKVKNILRKSSLNNIFMKKKSKINQETNTLVERATIDVNIG